MEFVPFLALAAINKKLIDWVRVLLPDSLEAKVLIPVSAVVGALIALAFAASESLSSGILIWSDVSLATADTMAVTIYGVAFGLTGGVLHDAVKPHTPPHDGA
jgi:hypothetical protein